MDLDHLQAVQPDGKQLIISIKPSKKSQRIFLFDQPGRRSAMTLSVSKDELIWLAPGFKTDAGRSAQKNRTIDPAIRTSGNGRQHEYQDAEVCEVI